MEENVFIENAKEEAEHPEFNFAVVSGVYADGLGLVFPGQDEPTEKHYKCNTSIVFKVGDRVRVFRDSGTYVVEYVVGNPGGVHGIPTGGSSGQALVKKSSTNYDVKWADTGGSSGLPSGGTKGNVLTKKSSTNYDAEWSAPATPGAVANQYSTTASSNNNYNIQFRTSAIYGSAYTFQIRMGSSGVWKTITVS